MSTGCLRHCLLALVVAVPVAGPVAAEEPRGAVAIVCDLDGSASAARAPGTPSRSLQLFDRLPPGALVTTGDGELVLAFHSGRRFRLGPEGQAEVADARLVARSGSVQELKPVPTVPRVLALMHNSTGGRRAGATRFRAGDGEGLLADLEPEDGESAIADALVLAFGAVAEASSYRVELEDATGRLLLEVTTEGTAVAVPAGVVRPAASYLWRVRAMSRGRTLASAERVFTTVTQEQAEAWQALVDRAEGGQDRSLLLLLAGFELDLGMWHRGCKALERAQTALGPRPAVDAAFKEAGCASLP